MPYVYPENRPGWKWCAAELYALLDEGLKASEQGELRLASTVLADIRNKMEKELQ
ncbi:hypothetical protein MASR2M78_24860 [Treponema sp.]